MDKKQLVERIQLLTDSCERNAADHDQSDRFVSDNYTALRYEKFFAAMIPKELGGGGIAHSDMCDLVRIIGQSCSSTALANSMHQHLLAAMIWKYQKGQGGEETLKKIASEQPVLVSTGARDWLESNGDMKRVENGYQVTAVN